MVNSSNLLTIDFFFISFTKRQLKIQFYKTVTENTLFNRDEIYIRKKLQPICKRSIFKKLLLKLSTECTFSINEQLCKQINVVSMGGTLPVVLSDCFMNKMEKDVVIPFKPKFYKRFVDDFYR